MNEVGAAAAFYLPRRPAERTEDDEWTREGARIVQHVIDLADDQRAEVVKRGIDNLNRFDLERSLDRYEEIYRVAQAESLCSGRGCGLAPT